MALLEPAQSGLAALQTVAARLAGGPVSLLRAVHGGRNNSIFALERADGARFALKRYVTASGDGRDRLEAEYRGLSFLTEAGVTGLPRPVAVDHAGGSALYEWVFGAPIETPGYAEVDAAARLAGELRDASGLPGAASLAPAREACLSAAELVRQVESRIGRILGISRDHRDLDRFLRSDVAPALVAVVLRARAGYEAAGLDFEADIGRERQTLSPSDFGFHNALKASDGRLVFVDFEYFGWDDPAKLTADFLLHPGMELPRLLQRRFLDHALAIFGADERFVPRLRLQYPLFGLRWCLIMLNEFLPERWERRSLAGITDRLQVQARQLARARLLFAALERDGFAFPMDA